MILNVAGIVGEYNPFHKGHAHHISETRRRLGSNTAVVCVQSGNFVQRGDVAVFAKHARAEAAVSSGADLVLELPLPWSLSSAEGFARGAVGILGGIGIVTHLSFGSESGDIDALSRAAEALLKPSIDALIRDELAAGIPYAAARQNALRREAGELSELIEKPNNILAVEYLKALYDLGPDIQPVAITRSGAGHDQRSESGFKSASELRAMLANGRDISQHLPVQAMKVYAREMSAGRGPVTLANLETALLSRLRLISETAYSGVPGATEGLGSRLCRAAWSEPTWDGILSAAKTKRYALSRIRRMLMCAALGVTDGMAEETPPYARLLAMNGRGKELLRAAAVRSAIPIVTKPAELKGLGDKARRMFELECASTDLYVLGYSAREERRGGSDWRTSPVIVS